FDPAVAARRPDLPADDPDPGGQRGRESHGPVRGVLRATVDARGRSRTRTRGLCRSAAGGGACERPVRPRGEMTMRPFRKTNRSAFLNFLRAKYEMYTGAVEVHSLPYYLCLDPSDRCQLRCPTCPTGVENELRRRHSGPGFIYRSERAILSTEL